MPLVQSFDKPGLISHHRPRYCGSHLSSDPIIHRRFTFSWITSIFYPPNIQTVPALRSIKSRIRDWSIIPSLKSASVFLRDLIFCVPTRRHSFIVSFGPIFIYRHDFSRTPDAFHDFLSCVSFLIIHVISSYLVTLVTVTATFCI